MKRPNNWKGTVRLCVTLPCLITRGSNFIFWKFLLPIAFNNDSPQIVKNVRIIYPWWSTHPFNFHPLTSIQLSIQKIGFQTSSGFSSSSFRLLAIFLYSIFIELLFKTQQKSNVIECQHSIIRLTVTNRMFSYVQFLTMEETPSQW